jgi:hypothetical protein
MVGSGQIYFEGDIVQIVTDIFLYLDNPIIKG